MRTQIARLTFLLLLFCVTFLAGCVGTEYILSHVNNEAIYKCTNYSDSTYDSFDEGNAYHNNIEDEGKEEDNKYLFIPYENISAGMSHSAVVLANGSLWAWGLNQQGQIGNGAWDSKDIPVQVGIYTDWVRVDVGQNFTVALKCDGSLWSWGSDKWGNLGSREIPAEGIPDGWDGTRNVPFQIGTSTDWINFSVGNMHVAAIKNDGSLWGWGWNAWRQLGDAERYGRNDLARLVPTQIGTCTDWVYVAAGHTHTMAIQADGTLWGWGNNQLGRIGDGSIVDNSNFLGQHEPVQIGTATNWVSVSAGSSHTVALKADGSLWAWGSNLSGQLGDGTTETRYIPTQIGSDTNWANVSAGSSHTMALKVDGSLWVWGSNSSGQLGLGALNDVEQAIVTPMKLMRKFFELE